MEVIMATLREVYELLKQKQKDEILVKHIDYKD